MSANDVYIESFENKEIPERKIEWQKRLAYCMHDKKSLNQLKVLFNLAETNDIELFEIVLDSLRGFISGQSLSLIQTDSQTSFLSMLETPDK